MKKLLTFLLVFIVAVSAVIGGIYIYIKNSKSPTAIAARTLANLQKVESASMDMKVDTGVKAEVGILQYFGFKDPETTITMNYDIDMYKEPAILHTNVDIKAFDIDALKNIEAIYAEEDGGIAQYFCWNDKWYRYFSEADDDMSISDDEGSDAETDNSDNGGIYGEAEDSTLENRINEENNAQSNDTNETIGENEIENNKPSDSFVKAGKKVAFALSERKSVSLGDGRQNSDNDPEEETGFALLSTGGESEQERAEDGEKAGTVREETQFETVDAVDFRTILEGIIDGSLNVEMREEPETVNEKECYVFDVDLTGDMLEKIVRFSNGKSSLFPKLKEDERVTGQLYIDSKESLPVKMVLSTGEILSEQLNFDLIGTSFSVTQLDIDVDVKGYDIGTQVTVPDEYVDINNLTDMDAQQWLNLALDITGLGDMFKGETTAA